MSDIRPTELHTLHFDLSHVAEANQEYTFHVCLREHRIAPHTPETLRRARKTHPFLRAVPESNITHYVQVELPSDAVALTWVTAPISVDGEPAQHMVMMSIHVPRAGHANAVALSRRNGRLWHVHPKLQRFGVTADLLRSHQDAGDDGIDPEFPDHITDFQDAVAASQALLFHHPSLINLSLADGGAIPAYILNNCITASINETMALPITIFGLKDRWMKTVPAVDQDGKPLIDPVTGKQVFTRVLHPSVESAMRGPLGGAIRISRDDTVLEGQQWTVQHGVASAPYDARSQDHRGVLHAALEIEREETRVAADDPYKWALANFTPGSGLEVESQVFFTPAPSTNTWSGTGMWSDTEAVSSLDAPTIKELLAGNVFVKIDTPGHAGGILRGQLIPGPIVAGEPVTFTTQLTGAAVVPPVTSTAAGTGTFNLNSVRTGLTYSVSATSLGDSASATFGIGAAGVGGRDVRPFTIANQSAYGTLTVTCKNKWLRHLAAYVEFFDGNHQSIKPASWNDQLPGFLQGMFEPNAAKKYVQMISPVQTVFGVPIPADSTVLKIPVPPEAQSLMVYWGGLGRGDYSTEVCPIGIVTTVVCEIALPIILLTAGTAVFNSKTVVSLMEDSQTLFAVCAVGGFLVAGGSAAYIGTSQQPAEAIKQLAIRLGPMMLSPALALGRWIIQKISESAATKAIPFFNVASTVVSGIVTAAQLSQTICEVLDSPFVFRSEITRSIDLKVTLTPDHTTHRFPDQSYNYMVTVTYDKGATVPRSYFVLPGTPPWSDDITVTFSNVPAGGNLKVYVFFYAQNGWQAGQGESGWIEAKGTNGSTLEIKDLEVHTNEVPLTKNSVYVHQSKIGYDDGKAEHYWIEARDNPPTATRATPSKYPDHVVQNLIGITTAQAPAQMAYCWQATGLNQPADKPTNPPVNTSLFTVQNLSELQHPQQQYSIPKVGFTTQPAVFYDVTSKDDGTGANFFIDPTAGVFDPDANPASGLHVRRVELTFTKWPAPGKPPEFATGPGKSYGRFPLPLDRYVLHPQRVVIGISYQNHKIFLLPLLTAPVDDKDARVATLASGQGFREGLVQGPRGLAVGLDGRVLILESINQRIQAFDLNGNPVPYFADPNDPSKKISTMALADPGNSTYLDLSVEAKGYLYVLRYKGDGSKPSDYQVDLYEPDGKLLVSTTKVAADKIVVDLIRNLYTLNYEVILGAGKRTEPSVSLWIPPAPSS
jgi:hypothetical protein